MLFVRTGTPPEFAVTNTSIGNDVMWSDVLNLKFK